MLKKIKSNNRKARKEFSQRSQRIWYRYFNFARFALSLRTLRLNMSFSITFLLALQAILVYQLRSGFAIELGYRPVKTDSPKATLVELRYACVT